MSISVEPDLFGTLTLGASCTGCAGVHNAPAPDDEAYGPNSDLSGPVEIDFIYNSNSPANGPFGYGRTLTTHFTLETSGDQATITRGNGTRSQYTRGERIPPPPPSPEGPNGPQLISLGGTYYNPQKVGSRNTLVHLDNDYWVETMPDGREMTYRDVVAGQVNRLWETTDSVGNRHTFLYSDDDQKLLIGIDDAYNRRTTLTYSADPMLLASITDFAERVTRFEYDVTQIPGKPLLTKIIGPTGCETRYEYSDRAVLTAVTDPNGHTTEYGYDAERRVTARNLVGVGIDRYSHGTGSSFTSSFTNPLGETMRFVTDDNDKIVEAINDKEQHRFITRDARSWELSRQDMTGKTEHTEYNGRGEVIKTTDALGHQTHYERDEYGNATKVTYDDGTFELMDWGSDFAPKQRLLLKHTDELGGETSYLYDSHGKVLSVTDALGAATALHYDAYGRLIRTTDALNQTTTFEYDAADNLTARVDALGNRWSYQYDLADRLTRATDAQGGVTQFGYDAGGNLTVAIDELGQRTTTSYNAFDLPTEQTDALGGVTRWEYDKVGRQIAQVDALGQRTSIEINNLGQVAATVDALGRRTETVFDANNRAVETVDALNGRITKGYNAAGWLTAIVDAIGRRSEIRYDKRGRLLATTQVVPNAASVVTAVEYDAKGQVVAQIDALGHRSTMEYDAVGRALAATDAGGNRTQMQYDVIGQQVAQVNALGQRTRMEYDGAGRQSASVDALNRRTTMAYDKVGRQIAMVDANNVTTRREYDLKGQQLAEVDGLGNRTSVEYDALGRQTAIVDALNHRTQMAYDAIGQLLSRRDALSNIELFTYDKVGNQTKRSSARGRLTTYVYDKLNRVAEERTLGETDITFTYDAMGQQLSMTDASGTTTNTYDALGRVLSETNGRGNRLAYEYDVAGRRTALVDPENGRTVYAYDNNGWLVRLINPQSGATVYTHDKLGRELTKTLPNGVVSSHVYNAVGDETLQEERDASGTLLASYASTYNPVGMKLSVTEKDGSVLTYRYYLNYALAKEERTGTSPYSTEYFYDAAGNPLRTVKNGAQTTTSTNTANQIIRKVGTNGTTNFAYDADGNLSSETAPDGSGKSYTFDGQDRLVAVEVMNAGGALSHRSEFSYDGFGRLVKSTEFTRSSGNWVKASERSRVFDGLDTVQERSENNQVLAQLTRDGNIGGILSRKVGANTSFFGYDGNGNVTTLSDAQGNGVGHYRYDGFGNALEVSGSSAQENEHRFSTKELHAPSGLYYYGFRFYSPALGRWISRDPIREMGGVNLYQMVRNNPVNLVDLYGLDVWSKKKKTHTWVEAYRLLMAAQWIGKPKGKAKNAVILVGFTDVGNAISRPITTAGVNRDVAFWVEAYKIAGYNPIVHRKATEKIMANALGNSTVGSAVFIGEQGSDDGGITPYDPNYDPDSPGNFGPLEASNALKGRKLDSAIMHVCHSDKAPMRKALVGTNGKWSAVAGVYIPGLNFSLPIPQFG